MVFLDSILLVVDGAVGSKGDVVVIIVVVRFVLFVAGIKVFCFGYN